MKAATATVCLVVLLSVMQTMTARELKSGEHQLHFLSPLQNHCGSASYMHVEVDLLGVVMLMFNAICRIFAHGFGARTTTIASVRWRRSSWW